MNSLKSNIDHLARIQSWYAEMCNDDWEHNYGIYISNIDNPGWSLKVELKYTYLDDLSFESVHIQREDENSWIICNVKGEDFQGYGGPENLGELIDVFMTWVEENKQ